MDTLPLSIRGVTDSSPLPDKHSLPESLPPTTASVSTSVPSAAVAEGVDNNLLSKASADNKTHDIGAAVVGINHFFEQVNRELRFERSDTGGKMVVQVLNQKTGEVIRQFPSEEVLKISQDLEKISGLLFKDTA